jgi:hypothetical protein
MDGDRLSEGYSGDTIFQEKLRCRDSNIGKTRARVVAGKTCTKARPEKSAPGRPDKVCGNEGKLLL